MVEFDDEDIFNLVCHPFGEGSSSSTSNFVKNDFVPILSDCNETRTAVSIGNGLEAVTLYLHILLLSALWRHTHLVMHTCDV